ncbi:Inherit from COG: Helicase [Seminavis robusta]|uniref:Inherit from COG: Helicase n=1 Tax=Seminavis robusta TaxID=568900 RepID=A0A9N8D6E4_9STRA|nr:Inherit from COG: Helicase [Seminavis robusta]|eukprot:Sro16_g011930.1 Inherit from COG: Helicase (1357) ;mRNA; r:160908-165149
MSETNKDVPTEVAIDKKPQVASEANSVVSVSSSASSSSVAKEDAPTADVTASTKDATMTDAATASNGDTSDKDMTQKVDDSSTAAEEKKDDDEAEILLGKKFLALFQYVVQAEEFQKSPKSFFCKDFDQSSSDWTANHFLMNDDKGDDCDVILTSYEWDPVTEKLGWRDKVAKSAAASGDLDDDAAGWIKMPCPQTSSGEKPKVTEDSDDDLRGYLVHIRDRNSARFPGCNEDLNNMVPLLRSDDIPPPAEGYEEIRAFIKYAVEHTNSSSSACMMPIYEKLHRWENKSTSLEMVVGIGHVRMVYTSKKEHQPQIVNGYLFEVPMQTSLQRGDNGSMEIWVRPTKDASISLNAEVMSAIICGGGGNSHYMEMLDRLVAKTNVASIRLDNADSYKEFLQSAQALSCRGEVRSVNHPDVHVPRDLQAMVITDAWCLLTRKKRSTVFSKDARNLMEAFEQKQLAISEPMRALLSGPVSLAKYFTEDTLSEEDRKIREDRLVYTLPVSESQRMAVVRLLVNGEPVFILEGPPGTGKTHSIVNVAATALSEGKTVIVVSSNSRALRAFLEKLPPKLRALALDMSCCKEEGMLEFQQALETLYKNFQNPKTVQNKAKLEKHIAKKKHDLGAMLQQVQADSQAKRLLVEDVNLNSALEHVLDFSTKAPWLLKFAFAGDSVATDVLDSLRDTEAVSFRGIEGVSDDDEFYTLVEKKSAEVLSTVNASSTFKLKSMLTESEKKLSLIKVGGRTPSSPADWQCAFAALKFRKACAEYSKEDSFVEEDIFCNEGTTFFQAEFSALLKHVRELKDAVDSLASNELKQILLAAAKESPGGRMLQDQCRELTKEIHALESELLYAKVVASLKAKLDDNAMSMLKQLCLRARKLTAGASTSTSERSSRHFEAFTAMFKEAANFMPFLVMTTDQVSSCLPPNHSCDIGIMDEASQSNCTALTFMARCKQVLVVGDDKQVSPSQVGLGEERIRALTACLPDIPTKNQLLPEYSFFDLFQAAFPKSSAVLYEHYRCLPEIIAISNDLWYFSDLIPLRLASRSGAVRNLRVKGTRCPKKKTNWAEAEMISDLIIDRIRSTANKDEYQSIGAISMGGVEQCKLIKELIAEKVDPVIDDFGSDVVDRHNILVGTPQEFQGAERDVIYLSGVHSSPTKAGQKLVAEKGDSWKSWNVALTRARDELIFCNSYGIKDVKTSDNRQKILRKISQPGKAKEESKLLMLDSAPLAEKVSAALASALKQEGYLVEKKGGKIWSDSLCIGSPIDGVSNCALLCIENGGESKDEWQTAVDQQHSLEGAGRACLRVDCLGFVLNHAAALQDILTFLNKSGLPKPGKHSFEDIAATGTAKKRKVESGA